MIQPEFKEALIPGEHRIHGGILAQRAPHLKARSTGQWWTSGRLRLQRKVISYRACERRMLLRYKTEQSFICLGLAKEPARCPSFHGKPALQGKHRRNASGAVR